MFVSRRSGALGVLGVESLSRVVASVLLGQSNDCANGNREWRFVVGEAIVMICCLMVFGFRESV